MNVTLRYYAGFWVLNSGCDTVLDAGCWSMDAGCDTVLDAWCWIVCCAGCQLLFRWLAWRWRFCCCLHELGLKLKQRVEMVDDRCQLSSIITQFNNHCKQTNTPFGTCGKTNIEKQKRVGSGEKLKLSRNEKWEETEITRVGERWKRKHVLRRCFWEKRWKGNLVR